MPNGIYTQYQMSSLTALQYIARSSMFQENQHFINDIPIFKAKDTQSFDYWLEQVDKVAALTNKDTYKLALANTLALFSRTISLILPCMGWSKN